MIETTDAVLAVGAPPLVEEFAITVAAAAFGYLAHRIGLVSIVGFRSARATFDERPSQRGVANRAGGVTRRPRPGTTDINQ